MTEGDKKEAPLSSHLELNLSNLFKILLSLLIHPICEDTEEEKQRCDSVNRALRTIEKYGISADWIIRYGMVDELALPLLPLVLNMKDQYKTSDEKVGRWKKCLQLRDDGDSASISESMARFKDFLHRFRIWASTARIEDLITLNPPTVDVWNSLNLQKKEDESVASPYLWLCDRYLCGELRRWSTTSLHMEYRFIHGDGIDAFSQKALEPVNINENDLNAVIAERAVLSTNTTDQVSFEQFFEFSKQYLKDGCYRDAAALFDFYLSMLPQSSNALNSKGFCLIPDSPNKAESIIHSAQIRGFRFAALSTYNLCCCQYLQHDFESALRTADNYLRHLYNTSKDSRTIYSALIWQINGQECHLHDTTDVRRDLATLCIQISQLINDNERLQRWTEFQAKLDAHDAG